MINYSVCAPTPCITKAQESRKYLLNDPKIIPRIRSFSKVKDFYLCVCFAVCTPPPSYECLLTHHIFFSVLKLKLTVYLFTHVSNAVRGKRAHVFDAHGLRLILGAWKTLVTFWSLPKSKLQHGHGVDTTTTTMRNKTRCPCYLKICGTKSEWSWT